MIAPHRIAFVVATKDRPDELRRLWRSLCAQNRLPEELVVVDSSARPFPLADLEPGPLALRYLRTSVASAARQRNLGLAAVGPDPDLVGFLDDDVVLEPGAVAAMLRFWNAADAGVGGAAFNMDNHPRSDWPRLKGLFLAGSLGLYGPRGGAVASSGFQTMIGRVAKTTWADWLPSTASVWRREIFQDYRFDEWFDGYSYLEDLDFSYRIGKAYRLAIVSEAHYRHLAAPGGRGSGPVFGQREVLNRLYFVSKHPEFSRGKCYLALLLRMGMNAAFAVRDRRASDLGRAWGNALGLAKSILNT
jgi:GT2 family glycosyltransferase